MIEEIRISSLGVIDASVLELGPGTDRHHRRDRCRQDHGRHRPRTAARRPRRYRRCAHRSAAGQGRRRRAGGQPDLLRRGRGTRRRRGRGWIGRAGPERLGRGSLARVRRWCHGARRHLDRGSRTVGGGARPVRSAPSAARLGAARGGRPLRRSVTGCLAGDLHTGLPRPGVDTVRAGRGRRQCPRAGP